MAVVMSVSTDHLEEVKRLFSNFLKERNLRQTAERFAILEEIYSTPGHFDADELFVRLKEKGCRVSRATVYNTLDLLLECDLVVKHQFGSNQAKYERAFAYRQHDHLICLDCQAIFEFCAPQLQSIKEMVEDIYPVRIKSHSLQLYGECLQEDCPNRSRVEDETA